MRFPTCDENGNCLYCGDPRQQCWCGAKHICLDCKKASCLCERDNELKNKLWALLEGYNLGHAGCYGLIADLFLKFDIREK